MWFWMDGWMDPKAVLRIVYSHLNFEKYVQQECALFSLIYQQIWVGCLHRYWISQLLNHRWNWLADKRMKKLCNYLFLWRWKCKNVWVRVLIDLLLYFMGETSLIMTYSLLFYLFMLFNDNLIKWWLHLAYKNFSNFIWWLQMFDGICFSSSNQMVSLSFEIFVYML